MPSGLKLHDLRTGIKREDQQTLNVLSKCGRYVETILKLISQSKEGEQLDLEPIIVALHANINYLQDEYAALLVKGFCLVCCWYFSHEPSSLFHHSVLVDLNVSMTMH